MPEALTIAPALPEPPSPPRKRWTRDECAALEKSGILAYENFELVNGELISTMGKNRPHGVTLNKIFYWLIDEFGRDRVDREMPIDVSPEDNPTNEPQPDATVFRQPGAAFALRKPQPADLLLVVEVSDSSLDFDRKVKALLYARAGIVEYWIADVIGRRMIVHRDPTPGGYRSVVAYSETERVAPLAEPRQELLVSDIFPVSLPESAPF